MSLVNGDALAAPGSLEDPSSIGSASMDLAWVMLLLKCSFLSPGDMSPVTCHMLLDCLAQCGARNSP